ncbi:unnamed protein product [Rotaria socialis]|uniref:Uncharacterized protein n=1 Tax=Rotaria socialis TaxID=392032 RepID=A0A818BBN1_9BILA|nr:unnamed protein product [Rotaria socialis]CAF3688164.1 unnamed protein product [Rotaria socialis]CAF4112395.1 unnamed protein product [Rotaria socialis]CAF4327284.1 unnamed protein product [Rotaria socialis]
MLTKTYNGSTSQQPTNYHNHHRHHHHRSRRSSPALFIDDNTNQHFDSNTNNSSYHHAPIPTPLPSSPSIQCSAYFFHRFDLDNYAVYTLRQTVDRVVTGPKSKGLKVKLSLPDEGLIIDNVPDPNQSWMYKISELLYFWRDPYYTNIIVIITLNRSYYQSSGPFSASIFRLRGNESVQLFIQRAQQFFAQLSVPPISRNQSKIFMQQSPTTENVNGDNDRRTPKRKSKNRSSQVSPARSPAGGTSRTEFEPRKTLDPNRSFNQYNRRTYSETTVLSDTQTNNSIKYDNHYNDDHQRTAPSHQFSRDLVAELMRELKEIRSEIAELKLEARFTPVRATSTSPFSAFADDSKETLYSPPSFSKVRLQSDMDAETQTDLSLNISKPQETSGKNHKHKNSQPKKHSSSTNLNNNENDHEEALLVKFHPINGTSNGQCSPSIQEEYQRKPTLIKPRPILKLSETDVVDSTLYASLNKNQSISNSAEEDSSLNRTSVIIQKEQPKVLSTKVSSSLSAKNGDVISFRSPIDDTISAPEHHYENLPVIIRMNTNQGSYYNIPIANGNDSQEKHHQIYVSIPEGQNSELQKQYLSQLFGSSNGIALLIPQQSKENTQETYSQQILFADHLTNPLFNIDKQLLANTIANQFGVDKNSPYLQQLIANQHLFVTEKRTFANMVWQMTPEEINTLCSSPITTSTNNIDKTTIYTNGSISKSILKSNRVSRSISKKQRITWDRTLE